VIWSLSILFLHVKSKRLATKKNMRLKGLIYIIPINLWLLTIYSTIFLNEFLMWFFLQNLVYVRLISKSPKEYGKSRLQWTPLHKIFNRKIIINYFQNQIFDAKTKLQKELFKNISFLNSNLVRFYLTSKYCRHQNLVHWAFRG